MRNRLDSIERDLNDGRYATMRLGHLPNELAEALGALNILHDVAEMLDLSKST